MMNGVIPLVIVFFVLLGVCSCVYRNRARFRNRQRRGQLQGQVELQVIPAQTVVVPQPSQPPPGMYYYSPYPPGYQPSLAMYAPYPPAPGSQPPAGVPQYPVAGGGVVQPPSMYAQGYNGSPGYGGNPGGGNPFMQGQGGSNRQPYDPNMPYTAEYPQPPPTFIPQQEYVVNTPGFSPTPSMTDQVSLEKPPTNQNNNNNNPPPYYP